MLLSAAGDVVAPVTELVFVCFGENQLDVAEDLKYRGERAGQVGLIIGYHRSSLLDQQSVLHLIYDNNQLVIDRAGYRLNYTLTVQVLKWGLN